MKLQDMKIESLENRVKRNREDIDKILNAMNEGKISISGAKEAITTLSQINENLLAIIQEYKEGIKNNGVGNYDKEKGD